MLETIEVYGGRNRLLLQMSSSENGRKLLNLLRSVPGFSHARISSLKYDPEGILLNGQRVPVSVFVHEGDRVHLLLDDSENRAPHLPANPLPLDILWEDRNLILLNKPAGQVCHPSKGHLTDSLANALLAHFEATDPHASIHFVGRLDKDTSGLVLVAKNGLTAERLNLQKEQGSFEKTYLALASGLFSDKEGDIALPMEEVRGDDGLLRIRRAPEGRGLAAFTHYRVLRTGEGCSLLEVTPGTGRMHQIRFHMSETGHALLGDAVYGAGPSAGLQRTALHACRLRFLHPYTGELIRAEAPLPPDMQSVLSGLLVFTEWETDK